MNMAYYGHYNSKDNLDSKYFRRVNIWNSNKVKLSVRDGGMHQLSRVGAKLTLNQFINVDLEA